MLLHSTGVTWDEKSLLRRYGFLRRIQSGVELRLLYYPYWLLELRGHAHWRLFGARPLAMFLVADALSGRCLQVNAPPELTTERIRPEVAPLPGETPFIPATLEGDSLSLNNINVHVVRPLCDRKTVQQQAETFALAAWRRRCNLPLGPQANISCTGAAAVLLHKPFWLLTAQPTIKNNGNKPFVFNASTGLGGVSEYWNVVEYIMTLDGNASAKRTGHPEPQLDLSA